MTLTGMRDALAAGDFSSVELTDALLERIAARESELNCFVRSCPERARAQAEAADAARAAGTGGPLCGLPVAHKDLFCTRDLITSCGSRMLADFAPPYDATVVAKLDTAGTVTLAKANMDEFAMGSSNENSFFGPVRNPWDPDRVPGGSSGGSAAAVAAQLVPAATATDTGGSIRQPAAFCGVTGIKPTYGRVSRFGMVAFASSLDQGGVVARDAADCALVLQHMAGFDPRDSTSIDRPVDDYLAALAATGDKPLEGVRIGLPEEYFSVELDPAIGDRVVAVATELEALGATRVSVSLPHLSLALPAYYVVAPAEASSNLSRFDGVRYGHRCDDPKDLLDLYTRSRAEGFGEEVKRRILVGTYALSAGYFDAYYVKAQKVRRLIANDFSEAWTHCDLILGPVAPSTAFRLGEKSDDPVAMYLNDIYTLSANLAGVPGLAMPCGFVDGLPVGAQLLGPHFSESRLLATAHHYQQRTAWHLERPAAFR
ncbi:MAG: Asp-tRNA(Asn)/Glu-tRNA(Gln) amidotransferase subunit GatA [Pseudomonadota bacterium]